MNYIICVSDTCRASLNLSSLEEFQERDSGGRAVADTEFNGEH